MRPSYNPESVHAHRWLDGKAGIEIGAAVQNRFDIPGCVYVDFTNDPEHYFQAHQVRDWGEAHPIDVVAHGDDLPMFQDGQWQYVLSSHLFEHMPNAIKCLLEWTRVLGDGGLIYCIIPLRDAAEHDKNRPVTSLRHHLDDYRQGHTNETHPTGEHDGDKGSGGDRYGHHHVFTYESFQDLVSLTNAVLLGQGKVDWLEWVEGEPRDSKVGNGHTHVLRVHK